MGYVDDNLMPDEVVVYRTKLHGILFAWPVLAAVFWFVVVSQVSLEDLFPGAGRLSIVVLLLIAILLLVQFLIYRTSEFAVTNKRVLVKVGFLRQRSVEILLTKVEAISVDLPLIGHILDYGSITIGGTGGTKEQFHGIRAPLEFRNQVQAQATD